jgi:hypothetical protein
MTTNQTPRLRPEVPLIWRAADRVHFGDHPVPVSLDAAEARWLASLKSHRDWRAARAACPSGPDRAERILALARAARAVDEPVDGWWLTPQERATVRGEVLALAHWHDQPDHALAARAACAIAVQGTDEVACGIRSTIAECGLRVCDPQFADIVVLVGHGHIDAIDTHEDLASIAHLPVRIHHARAVVGPVVLPGRGPCCRCLALHARDRDAAWPAMAAQWRTWSGASPPDRLLARRTAVEAVTLLREWIDNDRSKPAERIHLELPSMLARRDSVSPHDACGCLWQRPGSAATLPA